MGTRNTQPRRGQDTSERCPACHAEIPGGASFCPECGASQTEELWEECEITWWRGYVSGEFVAVSIDTDPAEELARSKSFRWLRGSNAPPEKRRVASRLARLCQQLEGAGWEQHERDAAWYAYRFRRPLKPPRRVPAAGTPAEPVRTPH